MRASCYCAVAGLLIAAAAPALPQSAGGAACPGIGGGGGSQNDRAGNRIFTFSPPFIAVKGLPGAPFSAQQSSVQLKTLANGTQLTSPAPVQPMMYRDAQGRFRTDAMMGPPTANAGPQITRLAEIMDSVAGYRYILDDYYKVAYRITPCTWPVGSGASTSTALAPAAAAKGITRTTEDLGTQTMSGVTVNGTRETTTFPPGTYQGNDQPVTRVEEDWRSARFGMNFLTKNTNPDGESTQTLTNFTAGDPDPALFQVPPGYQIVDETAAFAITIPQLGQMAAASPSLAQSEAVATCPAVGGGGSRIGPTGSVFEYRGPSLVPRAITGAPYSGQMTGQNERTLASGAQLTQSVRAQPMKHRDSAGRVRSDSTMSPQPLAGHTNPQISSLAEIDDPVAGYVYVLDDFHKIAHRIVPCSRPAQPAAVGRTAPGPATPASRGGVGVEIAREDLGTQTMSGVTVTGRRVTTTFPPGTWQGNNQPVARVDEEWYSAEFGMNFLTKSTTPDGGETTQTMTNFTAGEPNPALFQVPAGYQIVDETAAFTITIPYQGQ